MTVTTLKNGWRQMAHARFEKDTVKVRQKTLSNHMLAWEVVFQTGHTFAADTLEEAFTYADENSDRFTAPSSPVPAVERIELPGGFWLEHNGLSVNRVYWLNHPERGALFHINVGQCLPEFQDFLTAMSTPTPGRAAEPDTMGENRPTWSALDNATSEVAAYWSEQLAAAVTRAETAEAQLATLRAEVEKAKVPNELEVLSKKATTGPWYRQKYGKNFRISFRPELAVCQTFGDSLAAEEDSEFIVMAVNFVRTLLSNPKADR
jgi:hypothetical protein